MFGFESKLNFGKYKGKTVKQVADIDAQYLIWADTKLEWFKVADETVEYIRARAIKQRADKANDMMYGNGWPEWMNPCGVDQGSF